jgi:hypothetical protein
LEFISRITREIITGFGHVEMVYRMTVLGAFELYFKGNRLVE